MRNSRKKIKPIYKLTIALCIVFIIFIFKYTFFNILMGISIAFQDLSPYSIKIGKNFEDNNQELRRVQVLDNRFTQNQTIEIYKKYFNTKIMETKREINYLEIMNNKSDSVAVVVLYSNPKIFGPRIIDFFEYGNKDSIGINYYYWCYYCKKNQKQHNDTIYIHRKELHLYKKADTLYLKQYLD